MRKRKLLYVNSIVCLACISSRAASENVLHRRRFRRRRVMILRPKVRRGVLVVVSDGGGMSEQIINPYDD